VKRLPSDEEGFLGEPRNAAGSALLSPVQKDKFSQFFNHLIDNDRDEIVSAHDFEVFTEVSHPCNSKNNANCKSNKKKLKSAVEKEKMSIGIAYKLRRTNFDLD